jgi:hypothetical protein
MKTLLYLSLGPRRRRTKLPAHYPYFSSTHPLTSNQGFLGFLWETIATALPAVNPDQVASEGNKKSYKPASPVKLVTFQRI